MDIDSTSDLKGSLSIKLKTMYILFDHLRGYLLDNIKNKSISREVDLTICAIEEQLSSISKVLQKSEKPIENLGKKDSVVLEFSK